MASELHHVIHSEKWRRCVREVQAANEKHGTSYNPYAVCTAVLGPSIVGRREAGDEMDDAAIMAEVFTAILQEALGPVVARLKALEQAGAEVTALGSRLEVLEASAPVPGPAGPAGPPGPPGPGFSYRGVHVAGKSYEPGDCVTAGGSLWHCNTATEARPGDDAQAWTLAVKHGRDAR